MSSVSRVDDTPGSAQPADMIAVAKKLLWLIAIKFSVRLPV